MVRRLQDLNFLFYFWPWACKFPWISAFLHNLLCVKSSEGDLAFCSTFLQGKPKKMAFSEGSRFLGTKKFGFKNQLPNIKNYMTFGRLYLLLWVAGTGEKTVS